MLHKICIIGSGNWASAISRVIGANVLKHPDYFDQNVAQWVYEETVAGETISHAINIRHVNVKYLPGVKLPENIVAYPSITDAVKDATILTFAVPHQYLKSVCSQIKENINPSAIGISLAKGVFASETKVQLISEMIEETLKIRVSVLMGANIANEVAAEQFSESTVASKNPGDGLLFKRLFDSPYFRIRTTSEVAGVELCGALKNIVAVAAGFVAGMGYGSGTKAMVMRLGFMEMINFVNLFYPGMHTRTFLQSSGVADLIASCYGGRNYRVAVEFAKIYPAKTINQLEKELLNGQHLQGPTTSAEINAVLKQRDSEKLFPIFTAVHRICSGEMSLATFFDCLKNHPEFLADYFNE